jgi:phosphate transport system substrate-binding protein
VSISFKLRAAAALVASGLAFSAHATDITGAGATFIYPLLSKWSAEYARQTDTRINYQSIGSGGGIAQIKARTVDFGSSDKPLDPKELAGSGLVQFPSAIGGVVPVVNIAGVPAGAMKFDPDVLADIFLGNITQWNDPRIVALNGGVKLPAQKITVVRRSDGSGTTFNWTNYLSKVSPEWKTKVGEGTSVKWPVGVGGKGNEGVAAYVKQIKGGIGYVELSYALQNKMSYARMKNAAGKYVMPSDETFQAAAASADWTKAKDFFLVMTNAPGDNAWPVAATNFILMQRKPKDRVRAKAAIEFFRWAYANGDAQAKALDYVPLPDALVRQVEAYWTANLKL